MDKLREKLIALLNVPIYPHESKTPAEVVADYLMDNNVVPVVCCADCAYYIAVGEYCGFWDGVRHPEHFCGEGKREDEVSECQACSIEGLDQPVEVDDG